MKEMVFESAGLKGRVQVPASIEEFDKLANKQGACLQEAIANVLYRAVMADFRSQLCERIAEIHGIERNLKSTKGGKDETEAKFIKRAAAELGKDVSFFQPLADEISASLIFDPSQKEASQRTPYVSKADLETAKGLIAQGPEKLAVSLAKIQAITGQKVTLTGNPSLDERTIALAVKAHRGAAAASLLA